MMRSYCSLRIIPQFYGTALLFSLFLGCASNDLTRNGAEKLLLEANKQAFEQSCQLSSVLTSKPEFKDLRTSVFCDVQPKVTGIRKVTNSQVVVEWKRVTTAKPEPLKKWLESFSTLEQRLLGLTGQNNSSWFVSEWSFTDTTDGQQFLQKGLGKQSADITTTDQWRQLQSMKEYVELLLKEGKLESDTIETVFWLYDDGWRIGK